MCYIVVVFFYLLFNISPAFTQDAKSEVDSLLGKIMDLNKKLDTIDFKSETVVKTIQNLERDFSLIESEQQVILKNNPLAKLKNPEKEQLQLSLDNLKDEIRTFKGRIKTVLQIAPYLQNSNGRDKTDQKENQKNRIPPVILYLAIIGIFLTPIILAFLLLLWRRNKKITKERIQQERERKEWWQNKVLDKFQEVLDKFHGIIERFDEFYLLAKKLNNKFGGIERALTDEKFNQANNLDKQKIVIDKNIADSISEKKLTQTRQIEENQMQIFCRRYNDEVDGLNREFTDYYRPTRIGVENAMDRRKNPDISPKFITAPDGDYYAIENERDRQFMVVPRLGMVFQESSYGPGAMGFVFECPDYNPQLRYHQVKVVEPAFFEPDSARQYWKLRDKGKLDLGRTE